LMPEGTQEQTAQLRGMWQQFRALQDRIKELHTLRGRTGSERRKSTLFEDILAAKMELEDLRLNMRMFRRKMAGAELLAKVDLPEPRPQDYGLKPTDVE
jgi:hypothetical protein